MLHGDWKSAKQIEQDIAAGEVKPEQLIIDLWKRVDELQRELSTAKNRIEKLEDKTGVSSGPGSLGKSGL